MVLEVWRERMLPGDWGLIFLFTNQYIQSFYNSDGEATPILPAPASTFFPKSKIKNLAHKKLKKGISGSTTCHLTSYASAQPETLTSNNLYRCTVIIYLLCVYHQTKLNATQWHHQSSHQ
jgi:hypothetical protein